MQAYHNMPIFPSQVNDNGNKKGVQDLGYELEEYVNQVLKIPKIARMLSIKMFLGVE